MSLRHFGKEIKGCRLLGRDRWRWADQEPESPGTERRRLARRFLEKGRPKAKVPPTRDEFMAFGEASLRLARGVLDTLRECGGVIFAAAVPRGARPPVTVEADEYLRKDIVFLLERFFYFLQQEDEVGLLVMDESEDSRDGHLVRKLERYFLRTQQGRERGARIVPSPFFVSSEMTYPVQAADLCIYCINWGFRLPSRGMEAPTRPEVEKHFRTSLEERQFHGIGRNAEGEFETYGIVYVNNPYSAGRE